MSRKIILFSLLILFFFTGLCRTTYSQSIVVADYLPLDSGNWWTYLENGTAYYTNEVQSGTFSVNGVPTKEIQGSDGQETNLTNDANGIRMHRLYLPALEIEDVDYAVDITFNTPVKHADPTISVGQSFFTNGTASIQISGITGTHTLTFISTSTVQLIETVSVPYGTFESIKLVATVTIYGWIDTDSNGVVDYYVSVSLSQTQWIVEQLGVVKWSESSDPFETDVGELSSTNVSILLDDDYEENDDLASAWHPGYNWENIWLSDINGLGIQADDDWYQIDIDQDEQKRILISCLFTHEDGDIDIALLNSSGNMLAISESITDNESIDFNVPNTGTYFIRVYYEDMGNTYNLWWDDLSSGMADSQSIVSGLGSYPTQGGWIETFHSDYSPEDWLRIRWSGYNAANGETRIATGDIDGDGKDEIVVGLGPVSGDSTIPGGWFEIFDDDYTHLAWGRVSWPSYNSANGETWPACGDLDGDGTDEIIVGLGTYPANGGWFEVFDYDSGSVTHQAWQRVRWINYEYNSANGEVRPACGDIDDDSRDEIVVGLGPVPGNPSLPGGWFEIFDDDLSHLDWGLVEFTGYNSTNGETWPACGDVDGDGIDEIVVGLGTYPANGGWFEVFDYDSGSVTHKAWDNIDWRAYSNINGETRPTCGDIDGDGRDEIIIGLGSGCDGYMKVLDDDSAGYTHMAWPHVSWPDYCSANGETWPAVQRK